MTNKIENPWKGMKGPNYYTLNDGKKIKSYNEKLKNDEKNEHPYNIDLKLMPEPYIGNPNANIILLFTNPGLKGTEEKEYKEFKDFKEALVNNLTHSNTDYPYYYFNPAFKKEENGKEKYIAGAEWILKRTKELRKRLGENSLKILSEGIFTFQLHPFHSKKYDKKFPELEVSKYTEYLFKKAVQKAANDDAIIICIRSYSQWDKLYKKVFDTNNDFENSLPNNFIKLKDKNGDAPRTPFFNEKLLGKQNFEEVLLKLK
ncbi:hypothetical protein [Ferruginibacter sp.]|uniref:hypothetical protein n=1 Tax=Ferruginibacter sp. TaxID=1940288 RepID=UPI0026587EC7|nr:hypothetical protein [Ferruginibacter sp.]